MSGPSPPTREMAITDAAYQSWWGIIKGVSIENMEISSRHIKMGVVILRQYDIDD